MCDATEVDSSTIAGYTIFNSKERTNYFNNWFAYILIMKIRANVRVEGLEPPCLAAPDPKSGTSTNFATPAFQSRILVLTSFLTVNCTTPSKGLQIYVIFIKLLIRHVVKIKLYKWRKFVSNGDCSAEAEV